MQASPQDITLLRKLQDVDRDLALDQKRFDALPQRQAILEVRKKADEVLKNKVRVQDMKDAAEEKFDALTAEDERLAHKAEEIEALLKEAQGDFRSVESRSKELSGVDKRRKQLAQESEQVSAQLEKIAPVMKQIIQASNDLQQKEQELIASFQQEGGALKQKLANAHKAREALLTELDSSVAHSYTEAQKRCGTVALAELKGASCGACRNTIEQGKLSVVRSQAPLSKCPFCGRLLIVE